MKRAFRVVFEITKDDETRKYQVQLLSPDPAVTPRAWRFVHLDDTGGKSGEFYDLFEDAGTGQLRCQCLGFEKWQRCKHAQTLGVFLSGRVPVAPPKPERKPRPKKPKVATVSLPSSASEVEPAVVVYNPSSEREELVTA